MHWATGLTELAVAKRQGGTAGLGESGRRSPHLSRCPTITRGPFLGQALGPDPGLGVSRVMALTAKPHSPPTPGKQMA